MSPIPAITKPTIDQMPHPKRLVPFARVHLRLPRRSHRPLVGVRRSMPGPAVDPRFHESHLGPHFPERSLLWLTGDSVELTFP